MSSVTMPSLVLDETRTVPDDALELYQRFHFELPEAASRLDLFLHYDRPDDQGRLYPVLEGPDGFRGFSMFRDGKGARTVHLWMASDGASPGSLPGPAPSGRYTLTLDPLAFLRSFTVHVEVKANYHTLPTVTLPTFPEHHVIKAQIGWYRGELHSHTLHSDGVDTTEELVEGARKAGLDFLSLTDHFTSSGWPELAGVLQHTDDIALIRGLELTSHKGHANLQGIKTWVNPLSDAPQRNINDVIHDTHAQGGLFCVNHPYSNVLGWQRHDIDWASVDLLEIYHHLEHQHNILQLALWDQLLNMGYAIVGIAGTDSHNAFKGRHRLGQAFTYVYADTLSEAGIIAGLRRGRVYATLGPEITFRAACGGIEVQMFDSLPLGQEARFDVHTRNLNRPATLYVLKNGFYFDRFDLEPGSSEVTFIDLPQVPTYYRLEWHALPHYLLSPDTRYRSWDTFMTASNPIFAGAIFLEGRWK